MKKRFLFLLMAATLVVSLSSCSFVKGLIIHTTTTTQTSIPQTTTITPVTGNTTTTTTDYHADGGFKVTYENNNGEITYAATGKSKKAIKPINPVKDCATFLYWCEDPELLHEYDFNKTLTADTTIYAKYTVDYRELTNKISSTVLKSNVKITQTMKKYKFTGSSVDKTITGSGVIFYETTNYYYALTNNHVAMPEDGYITGDLTVSDCYSNKYSASELVYNDVNYDLAIVRFVKNSQAKKLEVIKFAENLYKNEEVIALGEPKGLNNVITYGDILDFDDYKSNSETASISNVNFEVASHSAFIDNGSSGGALLDTNLELVGINFASAVKNDEYVFSYAIPLNKVLEFINNCENKINYKFNL